MIRKEAANHRESRRFCKTAAIKVPHLLKMLWRSLNGDAAYERYLQHWEEHHRNDAQSPLGRKAFFAAEVQRKWSGVKRCC